MTAQTVPEKLMPSTGPLRLNLGGAGEGFPKSKMEGFLTVDLREVPDTDVVCDVSKLTPFQDMTVEVAYASNVLEHFSHIETVDVLKEWHRVLRPGGKLYVSVPDFHQAIKIYEKCGLTPWLNFHLMGDQNHELNYHYSLFTFATLAKALTDAGFSDVKRVKTFGLAEDGSINIDSVTGQLISLNVIAIK